MIDAILDSFKNLTPLLWVSQIAGIIGFIIIVISYNFNKKNFILISGISYLFFLAESSFAGLWPNCIVNVISVIRNSVIFFFLLKKDKEAPKYIITILLVVMWIAEISYFIAAKTYDQWESYVPPALVTLYTVFENQKNYYVVKTGALLHEIGFLIYYVIYSLPFSVIRQSILVIAIVISMIVMFIQQRKGKTIQTQKEM